jgi:hypothetical protein
MSSRGELEQEEEQNCVIVVVRGENSFWRISLYAAVSALINNKTRKRHDKARLGFLRSGDAIV